MTSYVNYAIIWLYVEGGNNMSDKIEITKKDVEEMQLLTDKELKNLSFHELCLYLNQLEIAEKILEGSDS